MNSKTSVHKCLLGVFLSSVKTSYISEMRKSREKYNADNIFHLLPTYTINENKGANNELIEAEYYLQFVGFGDDEEKEYLFVDFEFIDPIMKEEISNVREKEFFKGIDFKKILSNFTPDTIDKKSFAIPQINYLIFEIRYESSYDPWSGEYDCESFNEVIGYLDNNLIPQYFEGKKPTVVNDNDVNKLFNRMESLK